MVREDDASLIPWIDENGFESFEQGAEGAAGEDGQTLGAGALDGIDAADLSAVVER